MADNSCVTAHALFPDSDALDSDFGIVPNARDQREFDVFKGRHDYGAFEFNGIDYSVFLRMGLSRKNESSDLYNIQNN